MTREELAGKTKLKLSEVAKSLRIRGILNLLGKISLSISYFSTLRFLPIRNKKRRYLNTYIIL